MTPLILAIAAGVVVVIGAGIMLALRSRGVDEGARFRHVADITSTWSRQSGGSETGSRQSGGSETDRPPPYPESATPSPPDPESNATALGRPPTRGR